MCGILGSVNIAFDNTTLDTIKHRGPDDFGFEEFKVNRHTVLLSQRRLSIIDLSPAGHQPMLSGCKDYALIFNGEIYNHLDLRERLPDTIQYRGHSDTETILYYLIEHGIEGVRDLNGIFAIAFLDIKKGKLYLARDPFGVKPLYYHTTQNNSIIFSSEIRPIKAILEETTINKEALASLLRLRYNPSPHTLHQQVEKIRPGHYLEITLSDRHAVLKEHHYIEPVPKTRSYGSEDVVRIYGQKLEEAVKRQLLSDVEIGVLLSGGIDSAMVAALASRHYKGKLKAYTIGFEGNFDEDEIDDAAETARILGLDHYYKKISFPDFLDTIEKCCHIVEEPLATTSMIPMYFLSELASQQVKVVLTGQGADEPLGGYTRYKSELMFSHTPALLRGLALPVAKAMRLGNENAVKGAKSLNIKDDVKRFLSVYEVFDDQEIIQLIGTADRQSIKSIDYYYQLLDCRRKESTVERMMALDTRMNLADDLLNYTDKITMHFSMECRVPMLDLELVSFIESLPQRFKVNMKGGKLIHKRFAEELLPVSIISRKKKGFLSPTNRWFKNEASVLKEILLSRGTTFSEVFNQVYVAQLIEQHEHGYNREKHIFLLLNIYFWLKSLNQKETTSSFLHAQ
ncbi:asparagine synthase (glutamine-hydrolyzing) [Pontibacter sp. BT731]|uniref:asparagine synthase (glutamine-hydrolyzing) n=1 Tax=Pontibacter coccineus TaxID=3063328 RepID=UPI0026E3913E|nr:asparagine synthase (glutamine-hydrolyzing) [Pontibacter sp. BT731]MDO6391143.1 asparagine synthase (glutamine-hydrolyzing) [Pontibacter sp. BT731]